LSAQCLIQLDGQVAGQQSVVTRCV
jgi:hypothetical protein